MTEAQGPQGRVLIIAGSDSGGGAGIQADIKAVTMLGGYAMTAVTAITVQDTTGVHGVWPVPLEAVTGQMRVTLKPTSVPTRSRPACSAAPRLSRRFRNACPNMRR
jgi:hydroxymethylpyrimidine/phosphomethylpyrimidine kinase